MSILVLLIILLILSLFLRYYLVFTFKQRCISRYVSIPHHSLPHRVVVSIPVRKNDINKLPTLLTSLLTQSIRVDEIALNMASDISKEDITDMDFISKCAMIYYTGKEYSQVDLAIIPTLLREKEADTLIIVIYPDEILDRDHLQRVINQ